MSDCCSSDKCELPRVNQHKCPVNNQQYKSVSTRTVSHHVKQPWNLRTADRTFYFCDDPKCNAVYFSDDNSVITKSQLRTEVGIKSNSADSLVCYCFGVTKSQSSDPEIKNYIIEQTKHGICSCDTTNPSGKCCLKDFPRFS